MTVVLENRHWRWEFDLHTAHWSLASASGFALLDAQVRISCHTSATPASSFVFHPKNAAPQLDAPLPPHAPARQVELVAALGEHNLHCRLTCALLDDQPLFLWKVHLHNRGAQPVYLDSMDLLALTPQRGRVNWPAGGPVQPAFFSNGWQSWSYAGVHTARERLRQTKLGIFRQQVESGSRTPPSKRRGHFSSEMFGVLGDRHSRLGLLLGFLAQQQNFGTLHCHLDQPEAHINLSADGDRARLEPGAQFETDWACALAVDVDQPDPLDPYLQAAARENQVDPAKFHLDGPTPTGWCSWYQYSTEGFVGRLSAADIRTNLQTMQALQPELPLQICQIDDGYQAQVGDWLDFQPAFPDGVAPLAKEIRQAGCTPGLWLAPFIVHPRSRLAAQHPDWLLHDQRGSPVNAGFLWNTFVTALDLTHPGALDHIRHVIQTAVHSWGYPYLKLDFLYAAALPGAFSDPARTRAQVLRRGLLEVRQAAGQQAHLLGCGSPLGSAIGLVDSMRVSADTARRWYPSFGGMQTPFKEERSFPSARNAVHTSLARLGLHRRWWINDPDCLLLRPDTRLSEAEVHTVAATIALSGGSVLLSDDLSRLPASRLDVARAILPAIGQRPWLLDWFDAANPLRVRLDLANSSGAWHLLALYNWKDQPQDLLLRLVDFRLPDGAYSLRRFWTSGDAALPAALSAGAALRLRAIPAHGVAVLAARPLQPGVPQYLGSDLHISQGLEVTTWQVSGDALHLRLQRPARARGSLYLRLPQPLRLARQDQQTVAAQQSSAAQQLGDLVYCLPVQFSGHTTLDIHW